LVRPIDEFREPIETDLFGTIIVTKGACRHGKRESPAIDACLGRLGRRRRKVKENRDG
jgi:hypothetical protein